MQKKNSQLFKHIKLLIPKKMDSKSQQLLELLMKQAQNDMNQDQFLNSQSQWQILLKKLNTKNKIQGMRCQYHRKLIIQLIKTHHIGLYRYSYFNRSKLNDDYIKYLDILTPSLFMEVIMLVNKLKTIHKYYYREMIEGIHQGQTQLKIITILGTCNQKNRQTNSNYKKFLMIVSQDSYRNSLIEQLGKMLRQAWKKQKSKLKCQKQESLKKNSKQDSLDQCIPLQIYKNSSDSI